MRFLSLLLAAGLVMAAHPADAQRLRASRGEQDAAYHGTQQGEILPLSVIRSRINVPGAQFIGVEILDGRIYRLKYMRGSEVIWIDVDARTGRILGRQ